MSVKTTHAGSFTSARARFSASSACEYAVAGTTGIVTFEIAVWLRKTFLAVKPLWSLRRTGYRRVAVPGLSVLAVRLLLFQHWKIVRNK